MVVPVIVLENVAAPVDVIVSLAVGLPADVVQNTKSVGLLDAALLVA